MQRLPVGAGQTQQKTGVVMKKMFIISLVLPFMAFHCMKDKNDHNTWLEGKVVRISCASFIVQVTNNTKIGQDGWKDMMNNNKEYDDVINASNKCEIPDAVQEGAVIRFRIEKPYIHNNCAICLIYDAPPDIAYEIKDLSIIQ